jgi:hypothetical protein
MTYSTHTEPHPDELLNRKQFLELKRGGRQAAEDAAIEAYIKACNEGKSDEEAGRIQSEVYMKMIQPWKS